MISVKAMHLVAEYALSHSMMAMDAMIASTALDAHAELLTGNSKHFAFVPGLVVKRFAHEATKH
jgi:predicted nucleic acid-binding protein